MSFSTLYGQRFLNIYHFSSVLCSAEVKRKCEECEIWENTSRHGLRGECSRISWFSLNLITMIEEHSCDLWRRILPRVKKTDKQEVGLGGWVRVANNF